MPKKKNSSKSINKRLLKQSTRTSKRKTAIRKNLITFLKAFDRLTYRTKALFIFGTLFILISLFWHLNQTIQLAFFTPKVVPVVKTHAIPTQLIIPKVSIDLPIEETAINNGIWQVGEKGVSHLTISARPGEDGPIIMYGHNTTERLGPIRWLSKGDKIAIKTADHKNYNYIIRQTMTVAPNKMDIFTTQKGEALIIYTCDGFADLQRFVIIANPSST